MAKVAFLGLGLMGTPMASRLLDAGNDVTVWNRTPERTQPLADRGASAAATPAEAVVGVDVAITMLTNADALEHGDVLGLDRSELLDALQDTPIAGTVRAKRADVESGEYPPNFKLSLALKDLRLVTEIAERGGRHLAVAGAARDWLERAARQ